jgi:ribosomal protein S8
MKNITKISIIMSAICYYQKLRRKTVVVSYSSIAPEFLNLLISEHLISNFTVLGDKIHILLKYNVNGDPILTSLKKFSSNRCRYYVCLEKLQRINRHFGIFILSTSLGFISHTTALQKRVSGTLLFHLS